MQCLQKSPENYHNYRSLVKFDSYLTEAEEGQSKNILQLQKNILNRNVFLKSLSKSLTNLKNYCKS